MPRVGRCDPADERALLVEVMWVIGRADDSEFRTEHAVLMSTNDDREELVRLVTYLMSGQGSEEEQSQALRKLEARVLHPRVSDLIFWPRHEGFDRELTPDEVVDVALAYRPIEL